MTFIIIEPTILMIYKNYYTHYYNASNTYNPSSGLLTNTLIVLQNISKRMTFKVDNTVCEDSQKL
ncbi:MAG TPA: hypothetical protein VK882_02640, partial [Nitrososphaeraceae archaeon]|nr:hypothetical protein [Nitrososphaeraceae archaeon]